MKNISQIIKSLSLVLIIAGSISYASAAWTNPSVTPTGGNTSAPINVGVSSQSSQIITGALGADILTAFSKVAASQYCDINGANCHTSSEIGTSANVLASVGQCPVNQFLRGFDSSGNKICQFVYQIGGATENSGRGAYAYPGNLALATCPAGFYAHQVLGYPDLDGSLYLCLNY